MKLNVAPCSIFHRETTYFCTIFPQLTSLTLTPPHVCGDSVTQSLEAGGKSDCRSCPLTKRKGASACCSAHRIQTANTRRCCFPGGCWPRSGTCHCPFCLAWWWWAPGPPRSCDQCPAALPRLWTTAPTPVWKQRHENSSLSFCIRRNANSSSSVRKKKKGDLAGSVNLHRVAYGNTLQFQVLALLRNDQWMRDLQTWGVCKKQNSSSQGSALSRNTRLRRQKKKNKTTLECVFASCATLKFNSCPCSALVLIPYLQTNPALIPGKCSAKPADMNVISAPRRFFSPR